MNRLILYLLRTELGRRIELQILMNLVSISLGLPKKRLLTVRSEKGLATFTRYTVMHMAECDMFHSDVLYRRAYRLGTILRNCLTDRSLKALMRVVAQLYHNIGIEMVGMFPDEVSVTRCHFCTHYNPGICMIASNIDSGVIGGLYAAGPLRFSQRLTEGKDKCLLSLSFMNYEKESYNNR